MRNLCLLCLKTTDTKKCAESKLFIELLDVLLLNPWWDISKTPTLCLGCSMKIAKAFGFKANCVYTEDLLAPHIKSENSCRIDLRATYLKMKKCEMEIRPAGEFMKICCLCINLINSSFTFIMDLLKENNFEEKFKKYVPELNLCNIEDPLICQQCNDNLRDFIEFVTSCINTNDKVKEYRLMNDIDDDEEIDLRKVLEGDLNQNQKDSNKNIFENMALIDTIKTESAPVETRSSSVSYLGKQSDVKSEEIEIESDHFTSDTEHRKDELNKNTNKQKYSEKKTTEKPENNNTTLGKKVNASKSSGKPFKCEDCDFETATKYKIKKHARRKHPDLHNAQKYSCDKCDYQTADRYYLTRHTLEHKDYSEVEIYRCDKCTFESRKKHVLKEHYITHLSKREVKLHHCENCGYSTKFKNRLTQHKKIHEDMSKIKTFKCTIGSCTYQTIENSYLKKHILRHKKRPEMETLYCFKCDYQTKYKKHLRDHVLIHMGKVVIHNCKLCKFKTKWKHNLQAHVRKKHV